MKQCLAISMRMVEHEYPGGVYEVRDALSHDWYSFLSTVLPEFSYILIPNVGGEERVRNHNIDGIILTGGDDWGVFPLRDQTESMLFHYAKPRQIPLLGICRGAQVINRLLGGNLVTIPNHVGQRHRVHLDHGTKIVNSFHSFGCGKKDLAKGLHPLALDDEGHVEAFSGSRLLGLIWHPEREQTVDAWDKRQIRHLFLGEDL